MPVFTRKVLLSLAFAFALTAACSSSDNDGAPETSDPGDESAGGSGRLTLLPIEGLSYTSGSLNGVTSATGEYAYEPGQAITFAIGELALPSAIGKPEMTPFTLGGKDDSNNRIALNMTRLMLALDSDQDATNGIQLSDDAAAVSAGISVDFSSESFDDEVVNFVANAGGSGALPTTRTALLYLSAGLGADTDCADHAKSDAIDTLMTRAHGVSGSVTIVNDCTLLVSHFHYDGRGLPDVYFYGTNTGNFDRGYALGDNLYGRPVSDETFVVRFNNSLSAGIEAISVWCLEVSVSFGDGAFM